MENIKLHDTVKVTAIYNDRSRSFYDKTFSAVVIAISDKTLGFKRANGAEEEIKIGEDSEYAIDIQQLSEVQFFEEIEKKVETAQKDLERNTEYLKSLIEWSNTFKYEMSFIGKLVRFVKIHSNLLK